MIYLIPLHSTLTIRMTSIQGRGYPYREHIFEDLSGSSPHPESSYDKGPVNPPAKPSIAKYTKENLQKIFKTVLEAQVSPFDGPREKLMKARSPNVYYNKSYMECYNFCQQCEDHFATARAKSSNRIPFAASFLHDHINFCWQQYKRKHKAESTVFITWEEFKTFLCQSLRDSQVFVNSY